MSTNLNLSPEERRALWADGQRARRAAAITGGMCGECCTRAAEVGQRCRVCSDRIKARAKARRSGVPPKVVVLDKFNVCCQAHAFHRGDCTSSV